MSEPIAYTVTELLRVAPVGRTKFYEDLNAGRIKAKKNGRSTIVTADEAQRYINALPDYEPKKAA